MKNIVIAWLSEATGRDKSQFIYVPDQELFEMFFIEYSNKYYNSIKESIKEEKKIRDFANALAKEENEKSNRWF